MKPKNIHDNASEITWKFWKKYIDSFIILGKVGTIRHLSIYYPLKKPNLVIQLMVYCKLQGPYRRPKGLESNAIRTKVIQNLPLGDIGV
jgi:hypothetical protein